MGKRIEKLEGQYNEYSSMDENTLKEQIKTKEAEIETYSKKLIGLDNTLGSKTDEYERRGLTSELNKTITLAINKKAEIEKIEGYLKNKTAIEKIRNVRAKFNQEKKKLIDEKDTINKRIESIDHETKQLRDNLTNFEESKMNNEEFANRFEEYQTLLSGIDELDKEKSKILNRLPEIDNRINILNAMISKCNLAWTQLFEGKSWDEIQIKQANGKYTGKKSKMQEEREAVKQNKEQPIIYEQLGNTAVEDRENYAEEYEWDNGMDNSLINAEKIVWWKHPIMAFKQWRQTKQNTRNNKEKEEQKQEKEQEKEKNKENMEIKKEAKDTNIERDAFLRKLQVMTDPESVKNEKSNDVVENDKETDERQ